MAPKYWWQKVGDPDAIVRAASRPVSDKRIRYSTALHYAGAFRDEPDLVRSLMNADVPLALSLRAFDSYAAKKKISIENTARQAGYGDKSLEPSVYQAEEEQRKRAEERKAQEEDASGGSGLFEFLGKVGGGIGGAFKWAGSTAMEGLHHVWAGATLPLQAGYASDTGLDRAYQDAARLAATVPGGSSVTGPASLLMGVVNYGEGAYRLASGDISEQQKEDIRRGGGDPGSFGSRVSFYYQDYGEKRTPVSDGDVEWLKSLKRWDSADVDAAREIVTMGALEDLARSFPTLSERAQNLLLRANSDKNAGELLGAMADTSQTSLGGRLVRAAAPNAEPGDWFGPGSVSRGIAGGMAEVIATWHVDPMFLTAKGYHAWRNARHAVDIAKADALDNTIQMLKSSHDGVSGPEFAAKGVQARRLEQAMDTVEEITLAQAKGAEGQIEAAKLRQSWLRRFPGYERTLDLLLGMRNGSVGKLRLRTYEEAVKDAEAAGATGENVRPWVIEVDGAGEPLWRFTAKDGSKLTPEERAKQRAKVADELSLFILVDAYASGRELTGSRLLLPGQLSINGKIRDVIAPVLEAFNRRDRSVMKQLRETGNKPIDLNGHLAANEAGQWDQLVNPQASEWYRNNYTFGISHMFARGWRNFEKTFSNHAVIHASPDAPQQFARLVNQFMPKRQAQMIATMYAGANPAERWAMYRQTASAFLNVMNMRNTPDAQVIVEKMSKGTIPTDNAINGYKAGGLEHYTTPDKNHIRVGDLKMPAAVHPWQVSEGSVMPNWREVRQLHNRNKVLDWVVGKIDGDTANALVRTWKAWKVTTWANMQRQALEGFAFTAWRDPKVYKEMRGARKAVKASIIEGRATANDVKRLAGLVNHMNAVDLKDLEKVRRTDPDAFIDTVRSLLEKNGYNPGAADVLARMGDSVDVAEWFETLRVRKIKIADLAIIGQMDALRRVRAKLLRDKGGDIFDSPMVRHLDNMLINEMTMASARQLGNAADSHAWNAAERMHHTNREMVLDAAAKGITMRPVKVDNAYEWLGSQGDVTAKLWAAELGRRLGDPTGKLAARLIAQRQLEKVKEAKRPKAALENFSVDLDERAANRLVESMITERFGEPLAKHKATIDSAYEVTNLQAMLATAKGAQKSAIKKQLNKVRREVGKDPKGKPIYEYGPAKKDLDEAISETERIKQMIANDPLLQPSRYANADELMTYLYGEHPFGVGMRTNAARAQYVPNGKRAANEGDRAIAVRRTAQDAVDDLAHHLGGKVVRTDKAAYVEFPEELEGILQKVARGDTISADDLAKLPPEVRPEGLASPVYAPMISTKGGFWQGLANASSRAYGVVVARPMQNLYLMPAFVAHKRVAYGEVAPLMDAMVKRGMPPSQAAYMVEAMVNNRAINRVFKTTDRPSERTVFSEMGDKWLMFQRANEDFLRRFIQAVKASPEGVARANILVNAGVHTGIMHAEPYQDEEGNVEQRLTFTYPGTALSQRVVADVGVALGLYPDELTRVPQFDGLKSQVRFLNPGVSNPLSFSANPVFGMAIHGMEKLWPGVTVDLERIKRAFAGGQDFEGTEGPFSLKNLMPSMFSRFVPIMQNGDTDGQFQSAMRAAMMYAELAGQTPESDASPAERSRFMDAIKATATNILMQRAIFGSFLPASPQLADPQDIENDTLGRLQGLPNLRAEFFDIRAELSEKYPDNFIRANSEAVMEFARRYPGELISNPAAFSVGSTKVAGVEQGHVPYTIEATRWLTENRDFVKANPMVAIALMPKEYTDGAFSNEAYKLQLKADIRTHKSLEEFYDDLTLSNDINEYYKTRSAYFGAAKQSPGAARSIYARMDDWEDGWRRTHPLAAAEINRRANPDFVHSEVAPALDRIIQGVDPLPTSMQGMRKEVEEMYLDYQRYRTQFMKVSYYDNAGRAKVNKSYQTLGDRKWLNTPMAEMWDLMRVTEGR